jgi:hypothetical protein
LDARLRRTGPDTLSVRYESIGRFHFDALQDLPAKTLALKLRPKFRKIYFSLLPSANHVVRSVKKQAYEFWQALCFMTMFGFL